MSGAQEQYVATVLDHERLENELTIGESRSYSDGVVLEFAASTRPCIWGIKC